MNVPIIRTPTEWKKESINRLKLAFDALRDSRSCLIEHKLIQPEVEKLYQLIGESILHLKGEIKKVENEKF